MSHHHGATRTAPLAAGTPRFALVGSPNAGKTTLFNALTGLRAKTGNYPGVTVARYEGVHVRGEQRHLVEDLPGTYSLDAISPDEEIVSKVLTDGLADEPIDGLIVTLDATNLRRSLGLLAQTQHLGAPAIVVLTFTDELARRGGTVDPEALGRATGNRVVPVVAGDRRGVAALSAAMSEVTQWPRPVIPAPTDPSELSQWADSVLSASGFRAPGSDARTSRIDAVLLHPLWGTLVFIATMFAFFQVVFTVAAPLQGLIEALFAWLGDVARSGIGIGWLAGLVADGLIGGVGGVLVFLPQIALLFLLISLLEGTGYLARAAFLMDRVMGLAGLEGRAFVALLSAMACAIPGIMATRTLPSAKDRIATMMGAPLMTCSARLPVYVMLISMLVPADQRWGPVGAQGMIMFGLYVLGAVSAMASAWAFKKILGRSDAALPFYLEMPSYRLPRLRSIAVAVWDACTAFLRKVTSIILLTTLLLWVLLNFPLASRAELDRAGIDARDEVAVQAHVLDNSFAAGIGRAIAPVFEPLGFDWRVNVGVVSALAAREVFVATLGQVAAAEDPENPAEALTAWVHADGERAGQPVFTPPTVAALLVFFVYALQCFATLGVMRRETGTWRWSVIAFAYMGSLAWVMAFLAHLFVGALT
ncbi:ferrous iron transporter B [Tessaracoccus sp. OS52]|uniref:ferrous iron transporter B n=1 Tax=Tessaracoccus sp. OS52 TaxID=2886691 RepID=UPI001D120058|nr:ferrous iron transporter B [Tessaracoccus sp. OS52]MCC2593682.1 ferrous iron transporter B [Tessaracoccus sp. OS52]